MGGIGKKESYESRTNWKKERMIEVIRKGNKIKRMKWKRKRKKEIMYERQLEIM